MSAGDHIHHEQFAQHIEDLRNNLGVEFGRGSVTLPGGLSVPVTGLELYTSATMPSSGHRQSVTDVVGSVPDEQGNLHRLGFGITRIRGHRVAGITLQNLHRDRTMHSSAGYYPDSDMDLDDEAAPHMTRDPERFSRAVSDLLSNAAPPSPRTMEQNVGRLRRYASKPGMDVDSSVTVGTYPDNAHSTLSFRADPVTGRIID